MPRGIAIGPCPLILLPTPKASAPLHPVPPQAHLHASCPCPTPPTAARLPHLPHPPACRNFPVTARCLETLIRLATAHCKVRLGDAISRNDVGMACAMMDHVMRREIVGEEQEAPGGKRRGGGRRGRGGAGSDDDEDGDDGDNNAVVPARGADDVEMRDAEAGSQQQGEPAASMGRWVVLRWLALLGRVKARSALALSMGFIDA